MHRGSIHRGVQRYLQNTLGEGEALLEHPFPEIGRIADLFWRPHNLVFEVQVSPIKAREVAARNQDYASIGLQVVWVLHETRFNKRWITPAERLLEGAPHYYTDINAESVGEIYDQDPRLWNRRIRRRSPRRPISWQALIDAPPISPSRKKRRKQDPYRALLLWLIESCMD